MERYYVAYGSNLNLVQMKRRCPGASVVGTAEIKDYRLSFKGSKTGSYLTIEKAPGCKVPVAVWSVTENDEENLDGYEGYPVFYKKKNFVLDVTTHNGDGVTLKTFAYVMSPWTCYGDPSYRYFGTCMTGYDDFGFDEKYLYEALDYTEECMKDVKIMIED